MPAPTDPYSRHYWRFADEYPDVYANDHAYALWGRLLRLGDMAWPSAAHLPYGVRRVALDGLVSAGLIFLESGGRFRVRGMDKERQGRSDAAKYAVGKRWEYARTTDRIADGTSDRNTEGIPSRAEPRRAEPTRARAQEVPTERPLDDEAQAQHLAGLKEAMVGAGIPLPSGVNGPELHRTPPPDDEGLIIKYRAILADTEQPDWKREAAKAQLEAMGVASR